MSASPAVMEIVEQVKKLTAMEAMVLVQELETTFGVSATAPVPTVVGQPVQLPPPVDEEKTSFTAILQEIGANKIQVIKVVRGITTLGLKEAKDLVDKGPGTVIKDNLTKDEATKIKTEIEAAGGKVSLT